MAEPRGPLVSALVLLVRLPDTEPHVASWKQWTDGPIIHLEGIRNAFCILPSIHSERVKVPTNSRLAVSTGPQP